MKFQCPNCYQASDADTLYHASCARQLFGVSWSPTFILGRDKIREAAQAMAGRMSISGVQAKISVRLNRQNKRLEPTIVGGEYILKPQNDRFGLLPENEDLCMHLASLYDIDVPAHGLIQTRDQEWAYVIQRFDRLADGSRLSVEDMAQILKVTSGMKYDRSYEQIAKAILQYCTNTYLELTRFFERLLFCFVIGNGDMHLKNFSLITDVNQQTSLSPAYDLLSSKLIIRNEEDLALPLDGKKNQLTGKTFLRFGESMGLEAKPMENSIARLIALHDDCVEWIARSFLPNGLKESLVNLISERLKRLQV